MLVRQRVRGREFVFLPVFGERLSQTARQSVRH